MSAPWTPDYDTAPGWQAVQQATPGRVTVVSSPPGYAGKAKPVGNAMRVEVCPGELTVTSGYAASRSEVYARTASGSTPPEAWPDPPGSTRWYDWAMLVPLGHVFATDTTWLVCTQFKGHLGGSPPVAIEIKRHGLRLGGARTNAGLIPGDGNLGPIKTGSWTRLQVGIRYAADTTGWVEVWRDGVKALPRTSVATLDVVGGQPDPCYLKQGIYRDGAWDVTHVLYFGPVTISDTLT